MNSFEFDKDEKHSLSKAEVKRLADFFILLREIDLRLKKEQLLKSGFYKKLAYILRQIYVIKTSKNN